jgi:hypothetical protein
MTQVTLGQARAAKHAALHAFQCIGEVTGVGITRVNGDYALKVNVREPLDAALDVPTEIDGVPVSVEVTGTIRPHL